MKSPYDPAIPLVGIYPREGNTYVYSKTLMYMFLAAFFIKAPNQKQSKHP